MTKCKILATLIPFLCLLVISPSAFAHKVNIFAYAEGDAVYTESYFPDGKKVKGGKIEVYDSQGRKLLDGITDHQGRFDFKLTKRDDLKIVINASIGHRSSYLLSRDESPESVRKEKKISYRDIIGGIGCIFGVAGIAFYFLSKRKTD